MKRFLKVCAYAIAAVVVLVGGAALIVPMIVDPNDYRDELARTLQERTGRSMQIPGDLRMTLLPWLGVETGRITMGNAPGFGDTPFASLEAAQVRVKLIPLISREVEMDTVVVRGLTLNLARNAQGQGNWEDLAPAPSGSDQAGSSGQALAAFALGGVVLEGATVRFDDGVSGSVTALESLNARTGTISLRAPVRAELGFDFTHSGQGQTLSGSAKGSTALSVEVVERRLHMEDLAISVSAQVPALADSPLSGSLKGTLSYDDTLKRVAGQGLTLSLDAPSPNAAGLGPATLRAGGDLDLRLAEHTLAIPQLSLNIPSLTRQDLRASLDAHTAVVMNLESGRLAMKGLVASGELAQGPQGSEATAYELAGDLTLDMTAESADLSGMRVRFGDMSASGEIRGRQLLSAPAFSGSLATSPFNARTLLGRAGLSLPPMRDKTSLSEAAVDAGFSFQGQALELSPLSVKVDGTILRGRLASPDLSRRALRFDLSADRLDVDRYLPPGQKAAPPTAAGAIPVAWLRGLDVDGKLAVGALRYAGLDLQKVQLGITAQKQRLTLSPLSAQVAGGSYAGNISIDGSKEQPVIRVDEKVSGVDLGKLLAAVGVRTGRIDLRGGPSNVQLKATLTTTADGKKLSARGVTLKAKLGGKSLPGGSLPLGFSGNMDLDLGRSSLSLSSMKASVSNLEAEGDVTLTALNGTPGYTAQLTVPSFNLRTLAGRFGLPIPRTADKKAFTKVGFKGALKGNGNSIDAGPMSITLDRSTMQGSARINNFLAPAIAFDLDVDRLNVDDYLPPKLKGKAATPGAAATALPLSVVQSLNLNGTLKVKSLQVSGLKLNGVELTATAADGLLKMSPLGASLYGGRYDGNVSVDARATPVRVSLNERIKGVQIGELLKALRGDSPVTGTAELEAVLTASGGDTDALLRTLDGDVKFTVLDGTLQKIDVVNSMCAALAAIDFDEINKKTLAAGLANLLLSSAAKKNAPATGGGTSTKFTSLAGTARISKGVARNDDLNLTSPIVNVRGAGSVDLPRDRIDYQADAELVQACAGIGKRELAGHVIPVRVTGSLSDPKVQPSLPAGLLQALVRKREQTQPAAVKEPAKRPTPVTTDTAKTKRARKAEREPQTPKEALKDAGDKLLKGVLGNILKQ